MAQTEKVKMFTNNNTKHRINRVTTYALSGVIVGILLAACAVSPRSNADTARTLRIAVLPYLSFAPYYLAQSEGYFAAENLQAEFTSFKNTSDALPVLIKGDLEIDNVFSIGVFNAIARGEAVRVTANKAVLDPNACVADGFIARGDVAARIDGMSADELKQLKFGVNKAWIDTYFLDLLLRERGLKLSDVSTTFIADPAARTEAVKSGALDVAFTSEPWITRATDGGEIALWKSAASIRPGFSLGIVLYGPTLLNAKSDDDTAVRFMRAYLKGVARYREGKTDTNIAVLSKVTKLDAELLKRMCWPTFTEDGSVDAVQLSEFAAWAHAQGLADQALGPDKIWEPRFIEAAKK
jgi:NitT/TauT family transport system substrate-binding protein